MKKTSNIARKARKWAAVGCVLAGVSIASAAIPKDAAAATQKGDKPNIVLLNKNFMETRGWGLGTGGAQDAVNTEVTPSQVVESSSY